MRCNFKNHFLSKTPHPPRSTRHLLLKEKAFEGGITISGDNTLQKLMGAMRKAIEDYNMIENGDRIAVGVSGGKDSVTMLAGLAGLRRFIGIDFEIVAICLDPQFGGEPNDFSEIEKLCERINVKLDLRRTHIGEVIFEDRKEKNPCSLCARMRRGLLHDVAKENGCNKIALGHNVQCAELPYCRCVYRTIIPEVFDDLGSKK